MSLSSEKLALNLNKVFDRLTLQYTKSIVSRLVEEEKLIKRDNRDVTKNW